MKPALYLHCAYEDFKSLEQQMKAFKETTHKTTTGFYHKSIRIQLSGLIIEFHGPLVGGYGHSESNSPVPQCADHPSKFGGRLLLTKKERKELEKKQKKD